MNKVILIGRLTSAPEVRYTGENMCIARYTLAVDRKKKDETDFIGCVAFGKNGEFADKYLDKGMKICVVGRIQTGSYTNKEGQKVYTSDVVIDEQEFCEKKASGSAINMPIENEEDFMSIPDGFESELPFN